MIYYLNQTVIDTNFGKVAKFASSGQPRKPKPYIDVQMRKITLGNFFLMQLVNISCKRINASEPRTAERRNFTCSYTICSTNCTHPENFENCFASHSCVVIVLPSSGLYDINPSSFFITFSIFNLN